MNFEQLLKRAKNKDPEAKELLYEMFRPLLIHQAMISGRFSDVDFFWVGLVPALFDSFSGICLK